MDKLTLQPHIGQSSDKKGHQEGETYPEGTGNAVLVGDGTTLQKGRGPCPRRDHSAGNQSWLDTSACSVELLAGVCGVLRVFILRQID